MFLILKIPTFNAPSAFRSNVDGFLNGTTVDTWLWYKEGWTTKRVLGTTLRQVHVQVSIRHTHVRPPRLHDAVAFGVEQSHERAAGLGDLPVNVADSTEGANSKPYVNLNLPVIKQMENTTVSLRFCFYHSAEQRIKPPGPRLIQLLVLPWQIPIKVLFSLEADLHLYTKS